MVYEIEGRSSDGVQISSDGGQISSYEFGGVRMSTDDLRMSIEFVY